MRKSKTPILDAFKAKQETIDASERFKDLSELSAGCYIRTASSTMGFAKKVNPKTVLVETLYGGYGGNDPMLMELKINKTEIVEFLKPKTTKPADNPPALK